jgi:hypothetical protein
MKNKIIIIVSIILFVFAVDLAAVPAAYCATEPPAEWMGANIVKKVCPEAEITKISYLIKNYEKEPTLHFEIAIKNISKQAERFKVTIFLAEDKSISGLYPLEGKEASGDKPAVEAVIQPGQEHTRVLPVPFVSAPPQGYAVVVETY